MIRRVATARILAASFDKGDRVIVTRDGVDEVMTVAKKIYTVFSDTPLSLTNSDGEAVVVTTKELVTEVVKLRLEPVHVDKQDRPMPGDAVRLAGVWRWGTGLGTRPGDIAVIGGMIGEYPEDGHASLTFNARTHRDTTVVQCSGGPATIATDLGTLTPTDDRITLRVWRWRDGLPGRDNGKDYLVSVPVWEWTPTD